MSNSTGQHQTNIAKNDKMEFIAHVSNVFMCHIRDNCNQDVIYGSVQHFGVLLLDLFFGSIRCAVKSQCRRSSAGLVFMNHVTSFSLSLCLSRTLASISLFFPFFCRLTSSSLVSFQSLTLFHCTPTCQN